MHDRGSPVLVGGSGGSGTRMFAMACIAAGYDFGSRLNESYDALDFAEFLDRWINPYWLREKNPLAPGQAQAMNSEFHDCLTKFRATISQVDRWGWKNPRSMLMLPFFDSCFPSLRFLHVVRDGRDMAYSENQHQLLKHGSALLQNSHANLQGPIESVLFWCKVNMVTARYGEDVMGDRYLRCRFEDLCVNPRSVLGDLSEFLGARTRDTCEVIDKLNVPNSIGRWTREHPKEQAKLTRVGQHALQHFGYEAAP